MAHQDETKIRLPNTAQLVLPKTTAVIPFPFSRTATAPFFNTSGKNGARSFVTVDHSKPFVVHHPSFLDIIGENPSLEVIAESSTGEKFAHEAPVYIKELKSVFYSSNIYNHRSEGKEYTDVALIPVPSTSTFKIQPPPLETSPPISMANGAIRYCDTLIVCAQGFFTTPSSVTQMELKPPFKTKEILNNYMGRAFNSINDIAVLPPPNWAKPTGRTLDYTTAGEDGHGELGTTIWFTDPTYGADQKFKSDPELPSQVYCFNPQTGDTRVVADGFDHPNGICFNLEGTICYITDTGFIHGSGKIRPDHAGTIYAFDVVHPPQGSDLTAHGPILKNRRVFAFTDSGAPDGVKCDHKGNVYSGCFDGLHVWNSSGTLIGRITFFPDPESSFPDLARTCANFCFVPGGGIVLMAEDRIYFATLTGKDVKGALLLD